MNGLGQVDQTTDFAGLPALFLSARYIYKNEVEERTPMPLLTTGEDTFNLTDLYKAEIYWKQCVDICTDGAGKTRGFVAPVKAIALECTGSHVIVHRHVVAWKTFQTHSKWRSTSVWRDIHL
jgi:hypothetical protein